LLLYHPKDVRAPIHSIVDYSEIFNDRAVQVGRVQRLITSKGRGRFRSKAAGMSAVVQSHLDKLEKIAAFAEEKVWVVCFVSLLQRHPFALQAQCHRLSLIRYFGQEFSPSRDCDGTCSNCAALRAVGDGTGAGAAVDATTSPTATALMTRPGGAKIPQWLSRIDPQSREAVVSRAEAKAGGGKRKRSTASAGGGDNTDGKLRKRRQNKRARTEVGQEASLASAAAAADEPEGVDDDDHRDDDAGDHCDDDNSYYGDEYNDDVGAENDRRMPVAASDLPTAAAAFGHDYHFDFDDSSNAADNMLSEAGLSERRGSKRSSAFGFVPAPRPAGVPTLPRNTMQVQLNSISKATSSNRVNTATSKPARPKSQWFNGKHQWWRKKKRR
jgi:hypothetical protein